MTNHKTSQGYLFYREDGGVTLEGSFETVNRFGEVEIYLSRSDLVMLCKTVGLEVNNECS